MAASRTRPLVPLRKLCLALPEAHEVEAWGEATFRVRNKMFAMHASASNHHGRGRPAVWLKAKPGMQELMVRADPDRYFVPPYVGKSGWLGIWLDGEVEWHEVDNFVRDSYRLIAPKRLLKVLDPPPE
jgi:predicted DNA-binding protein (MmcQ/YjbR family)